jgi:glycosyltransferase involved in cell wall biosynthesis
MKAHVPISVVIPAHNEESFIEEAIRSVHNQTLKVSEILVVADDCTDRTADIAQKLGATVLDHSNRNMAIGLNMAVKSTNQPWIAFLDADDYWHTEKIAYQWKAITDYPAAALVFCDLSMILNDEIILSSRKCASERWDNLENVVRKGSSRFAEQVHGDFLLNFFLATPTVMVRREVFPVVGFFDESLPFGQTLEFFARVLAHHSLVFVEKPLVFHRRHDRNHTNNLEEYWPTYISVIDRMLKYPEFYPPGTGEVFRERLKRDFHQFERGLLKEKNRKVVNSTIQTTGRRSRLRRPRTTQD